MRKQMRLLASGLLAVSMAGCSGTVMKTDDAEEPAETETVTKTYLSEADIEIKETLENTADGEHVITADGEERIFTVRTRRSLRPTARCWN